MAFLYSFYVFESLTIAPELVGFEISQNFLILHVRLNYVLIPHRMKTKYELEYTFNTSPNFLYPRLSTPEGLSEWFADDVNLKRGKYTFCLGRDRTRGFCGTEEGQ